MSRILVTGAGGFVGSRLCAVLTARGIAFVPTYRQARAESPDGVAVGAIDAFTNWMGALQDVDAVVHLAARVHVMDDQSADPLLAFREANVAVTMNLARQAVSAGVRRFIFVSSVKVNGEESKNRAFTAADIPAPLDPYGISKHEAEIALRELSRVSGIEVVIVRPPLIYGPGVRANFLRLMMLAQKGLPVPFGAVRNQRSLVALDNLVDFLLTCCRHPRAAGEIFLVSDDHDVSIGELHSMLATSMGRKVLSVPVPVGLIRGVAALLGKSAAANRLVGSLQVDISASKSLLGWTPPVSMVAAVQETVAHFLIGNLADHEKTI